MTLPSQSDRLVWGVLPGGLSAFAHSFMVFGVTSIMCCKPIIVHGPPGDADEQMARCPGCVAILAELDAPFTGVPAPGEQPYSVHRHPELIKTVAAEFDAAGGRWAALQQRPVDMRRVHREIEAVVREHHDNFPALLREVTGYLDLAMQAAYEWRGYDDAQKGTTT